MPQYINIHTHKLSDPLPEDVLEMVSLHDRFETMEQDRLYSVGIHPWHIGAVAKQLAEVEHFALRENVNAIGECGLDKVCNTDWDIQLRAFEQQVEIANTLQKPMVIHCVRAYNEVLRILKKATVPAIFHGFNKKPALALDIIGQGHYLSFGAALPDNNQLREVFTQIPPEHFFLETDDAGISIKQVYKAAAEIRKTREDVIILQLIQNYKKVFGT